MEHNRRQAGVQDKNTQSMETSGNKWKALRAPRVYWETSGRQGEAIWKTKTPECSAKTETQGGNKWRQVGGKSEIRASKVYRETSEGKVEETNLKSRGGQKIQSVAGDKWETSAKSREQRILSVLEKLGDEVTATGHGGKSTHSILGDKWHTNVKSRGRRVQSVVEDHCAISCGPGQSEHPECTGDRWGESGGQT